MDLPREQVELKHELGQQYATLLGKGQVFNFRFSKLCLACAPGTPPTPGGDPALLDQEFSLLDAGIRHFYPAWRQIYQMNEAKGGEKQSPNRMASSAPPARAHAAAAAKTASAPQSVPPAAARAEAPPPPRPEVPVAANPHSAAPSKPAAAAVAKPVGETGVRAALSGPVTPFSVPNSAVAGAVKPLPPGAMIVPRMKPVKIDSGAADGLLVKKIPPDYPLEAKLVRLEGTVVLHAIIDRSGEVSQVSAVSGPPLLESAAVDAVKQWQYRPYSQNGQPVDVETTIAVVFALDGSHGTRSQSARR
jgi:protein TonB